MTSTSAMSGIAVIGIGCRLPGASDHRAYWKNLCAGIESITTLSDHQLAVSRVPSELMRDPSYVKAVSLLPDSDCFDAPFFEYSPQEARLMDPQHRLLLEVAWTAFEDAGYRIGEHPAHVGVFVGLGGVVSSYLLDRLPFSRDLPGYTGGIAHLGNDKDFPSTRISYKLNLTGPSINVQSACSTSLVAAHLACQSILAGECEMALAGAATVRVPQHVGYMSVKGGILSADGHCRAFDADASGTIFGSGVALVLLKELSAAVTDGDHIYAVIRGSAINNDGADKVSYTASSVTGQAGAMVEAMSLAGISPDDIGYVECHGTGTIVGDPLEIDGLTRAFRTKTKRCGFCAVGSVKTNIGHLEQTAGVASLIKAALALHHGEIPPSLNFHAPNPKIDFASTPFFVNTERRDWPAGDQPRFAAVNSLGLGGTNAFVVLQEAPRSAPGPVGDGGLHFFTTSAKSDAALRLTLEKYRRWLDEPDVGDATLADICFTSTVGRSHFSKRNFVIARSKAELRRGLDEQAVAADLGRATSPEGQRLAFVFSGQASQYPRMGADLYREYEVFRNTIDRCSEVLEHRLPRPLKDTLLDDAEGAFIDDTGNTQPALFSVQAALVDLWRSWGIVPDLVMGHSVGEFAASYCAGAYTLEQALDLIADRANIMQALPRNGAMIAVFVDEQSAAQLIEQLGLGVSIAAANAPQSTVISGVGTEIEVIADHCRKCGIEYRTLNVSHAFHSSLMIPAAEEFALRAVALCGKAPRIAWVSTLSGKLQTAPPDAQYWRAHALATVRFAEGMREVARHGATDVVEIGPGGALLALGQQCVSGDITWLASLRNKSEIKEILSSLGRIYCRGYRVDWSSFHRRTMGRRVSMPTYGFEKRRYWIEDAPARSRHAPASANLLGVRMRSALPQFEAIYSLDRLPYLDHHRIYGTPVLPLTVALAALREAARESFNADEIEVINLQYQEAMQLPESGTRIVQIILTPRDARMAEFRLASTTGDDPDGWHTHLIGAVRARAGSSADSASSLAIGDVKSRCTEFIPADRFYHAVRAIGLEYGVSFQGIQSVSRMVAVFPAPTANS
nr:phthiocerol synthesis polyketide synthase type I PpsE [uncultured bacterium]